MNNQPHKTRNAAIAGGLFGLINGALIGASFDSVLFGALIVFTESSAIAPFIYALF